MAKTVQQAKPPTRPCPDCGVKVGEKHIHGCDVERCPLCDGQLIGCLCIYTVNGMNPATLETDHPTIYNEGATDAMWAAFDAEVEKRSEFQVWTGEWPGVAECRERGWYCQDGHGPDPRWGSFCPCPPNAPGATEDLNRLAFFKATGRDGLYDGCTRKPRT
jgi:hypothetical protein